MKKGIIMTSLSLIAVFLLVLNFKPLTAHADSDTILDVTVKYITEEDADMYNDLPSSRMKINENPIQEGDYAISLTIQNNTRFAATGYRIYYHSALCSPIMYTDNSNYIRPVYYVGNVLFDADIAPAISYNPTEHILSIGTISTNNATTDGTIVTFFVRPTHELSLTEQKHLVTSHSMDRWLDTEAIPIEVNVNNGYTLYRYVPDSTTQYWIIGDIDQDGEITAVDAQLILSLYTDYTVTDGQIIYTSEYNGTYTLSTNPATTADGIYVVTVSDVNSDGVVDVEDASLVLQYYTDYEVGQGNLNNYNGLIGTETGVYIEYTVTFD